MPSNLPQNIVDSAQIAEMQLALIVHTYELDKLDNIDICCKSSQQ